VQLFSTFLRLWLPSARDNALDQFIWTAFVPDVVNQTGLIKASCDAIAYGFIGMVYNDGRCRYHATLSYTIALALVRRHVNNHTHSPRGNGSDVVLASIVLLSRCESMGFTAATMAGFGKRSLLVHLGGAEAWLAAYNAEINETELGRALGLSLTTYAILKGFFTRQPLPGSWDEASEAYGQEVMLKQQLWSPSLNLQLPELLRRADSAMKETLHSPITIEALFIDVCEFKQRWLAFFHHNHTRRRPPLTVNADAAVNFSATCPNPQPFTKVYAFSSMQDCAFYTWHWWVAFLARICLRSSTQI
jgi:hypothetical protein